VRKCVVGALLIAATAAQFAIGAGAGPLDPRFDGRWVGVETFQYHSAYEGWAGKTPQMTAVIVIAESGTMVGVVGGFAPGRYLISPKSKGNTIMFDSALRRAKLVLSPDGNTMKEDGNAAVFVPHRGNVLCQVMATFRRVGK
jgi:hypothetical protein